MQLTSFYPTAEDMNVPVEQTWNNDKNRHLPQEWNAENTASTSSAITSADYQLLTGK